MDEQRDGLILIVEDDEATKGFLADNLAADGFRVASASSAAEGLRAIEVRRPCLVLLDLRLEGGSGLDVLDRVRAADGLATRIDPDLAARTITSCKPTRFPRCRAAFAAADEVEARPARPRSSGDRLAQHRHGRGAVGDEQRGGGATSERLSRFPK